MVLGDRLRELRQQKNLSQGDIQKRTGLLRCYISRVENGHTVPSIETLEKMARAFEVPMYRLFHEGDTPPNPPAAAKRGTREPEWGSKGRDARFLSQIRTLLAKVDDRRRGLILALAQKAAQRNRQATS
jgi:transcriptional regulator with XRE-family HTH domain